MDVGLEVVIKRSTHVNILKAAFSNIGIENYTWTVDNVDILTDGDSTGLVNRFSSSVIGGVEFAKMIFDPPDYWLYYADLKAFNCPGDVQNVTTYEDYLHSGCQIIFLLYDDFYVDIYAKQRSVLETINENIVKLKCAETLSYISDDKDKRTKMAVW